MIEGVKRLGRRVNWPAVLKIAVTIVVLGLLARFLDIEKLSDAIVAVDWHWMLLGCAASAIFVALRIEKWRELASKNGLHANRSETARASLFALALGLVTPARAGEVAAVAPFGPGAKRKAVLTHVYDRICELFAVLALCLPAALILLGWPGFLLSALIVAVYALGLVAAATSAWRQRFGRISTLQKIPKLEAILSAVIVTSPRYWALSFASFVAAYVLVIFFIVGVEPIGNWQAVFVLPVVTLSNLITVTVGGLGVREGLAAAMSPGVGLTPEVTAAAFFLSFFWTRLVPGLVGLAWVVLRMQTRSDQPRGRPA
jgi:glycosyltransferase 2 family protein